MIRQFTQKNRSMRRPPLGRSIVTRVVEPPLDSSIPERPCVVALVQDQDLYGTKKTEQWQDQLETMIPNEFGMTFCNINWNDESTTTTEEGLTALQTDLMTLRTPAILLIARGPRVSWLAQLYLESYSLSGLVLVDPLPLNPKEPFQASRPLLLEPGSVPMMVLQSLSDPVFARGAQQVAERHRLLLTDQEEDDTVFVPGDVPIVKLSDDDKSSLETTFRESVHPWIESRVL